MFVNLLPPSVQVMATFTQRSEVKVTPVKSQKTSSPSSLADAGSRSYPSLPEQSGEAPSSSTETQRPSDPVQQVGDEHMFHQKVISILAPPPSTHTRYVLLVVECGLPCLTRFLFSFVYFSVDQC